MDYGQPHDEVELPIVTSLEKGSALRIAPAESRRWTGKRDYERQNIASLFFCLAVEISDDRGIGVNRNHFGAAAGGDPAKVPGIASDIEVLSLLETYPPYTRSALARKRYSHCRFSPTQA